MNETSTTHTTSSLRRLASLVNAWDDLSAELIGLHQNYDRRRSHQVSVSSQQPPELSQPSQAEHLLQPPRNQTAKDLDVANSQSHPKEEAPLDLVKELHRDKEAYRDSSQLDDPLEMSTSVGHALGAVHNTDDLISIIVDKPPAIKAASPHFSDESKTFDRQYPARSANTFDSPKRVERSTHVDLHVERGSRLGFDQAAPSQRSSAAQLWSREGFTPIPQAVARENAQILPRVNTLEAVSHTSHTSPVFTALNMNAPHAPRTSSYERSQSSLFTESLPSAHATEDELEAFSSVAERLMRAQDQDAPSARRREEHDSSQPTSLDMLYSSNKVAPSQLYPQGDLGGQRTLVSAPERLKTRSRIPWRLTIIVSVLSIAVGALVVYYTRL